jgi:cytochrome c-type biogenesis protein CcmH/NrfF
MLTRIFPERIDNHYREYKAALWIFVPITLIKIGVSLIHIFLRRRRRAIDLHHGTRHLSHRRMLRLSELRGRRIRVTADA